MSHPRTTTRITRIGLSLTAALVGLGLLSGCGGSSDAAADAGSSASASASSTASGSVDELCEVLSTASVTNGKQVAQLAADLADAGAPDAMTTKQRAGFDAYVEALEAIDPATTKKELKAITDLGFTAKEEKQVEAFWTYATTTCV